VKNPTDKIKTIYSKYIDYENEQNRINRYEGNEHFYHASGAGMCSRKLYYQSVEKIEPTNLPNETSNRLLRLGTVVHDDIQKSLELYNNDIYNTLIYNNIYNTKEKENYRKEKETTKFHIEQEIQLEQYGVRGFYDCVMEDSQVTLIDFKTANSYSFKLKFGRIPKPNVMTHQEMQLGTYGLAVQEKFGRLDGMYLMYYNKDTSVVKETKVPLTFLKKAESFWSNINREHERGLPMFKEGVSPVQDWECKYCQFYDHCRPPFR
tara:strand:+ start:2696 stop:3484 length:789 start_codon:yes stop_codon:yes gene_type:complete